MKTMHPRRVCVLLGCISTLKEAAFSAKKDSTKALLASLSARRVQKGAPPTLAVPLLLIGALASGRRLRKVKVMHHPFAFALLVQRLAVLDAMIVDLNRIKMRGVQSTASLVLLAAKAKMLIRLMCRNVNAQHTTLIRLCTPPCLLLQAANASAANGRLGAIWAT